MSRGSGVSRDLYIFGSTYWLPCLGSSGGTLRPLVDICSRCPTSGSVSTRSRRVTTDSLCVRIANRLLADGHVGQIRRMVFGEEASTSRPCPVRWWLPKSPFLSCIMRWHQECVLYPSQLHLFLHSSRVPALCLTSTSVTLYRFASLAVDNLSIKQVGDWFEILQKKRGRRALSQRL